MRIPAWVENAAHVTRGTMADHAEWLTRNYKHDRLSGRGAEYAAAVRRSGARDLQLRGYDVISHHDCNTGETIYFVLEEQK